MAGELETGTPCGIPVSCGNLAGLRYVTSLLALGAIDDLELDRLTFLERPEAIALDGREVHEYVRPAFAFNETVTLRVVEPLDLTCDTHRPFPALRSRGAWRRIRPIPGNCSRQWPWTQKKTASARPRLTIAGLPARRYAKRICL